MIQQTGDSIDNIKKPLVSVIIPCYNQGRFLSKAIQSAKEQSHPNVEIIVINDGSTDETAKILQSIEGIKCITQENQGLPNARNRGIKESSGKYLAFLDADDWFFPDAIEKNLQCLEQGSTFAFSSGGHTVVDENEHNLDDRVVHVEKDHYLALLQNNYIGNPSTVLYTRWIMEKIPFDNAVQIKGCEDYDHYLKITRTYPVMHQDAMISVYRKHGGNMSDNFPMMLQSVLFTLKRQLPLLLNQAEKNALKDGLKHWKIKYLNRIYDNIRQKKLQNISPGEKEIIQQYAMDLLKIFGRKTKMSIKKLMLLNKD
jgi:glycosyltransferase involved in cell wall biosynthesis